MSSQKSKRNNRRRQQILYIIGWVFSAIQIAATVWIIYFLRRTNLVPKKMMLAGIVVAILLILLCRLFMTRKIKIVRYIVGAVLALLLSAAMVGVGFYAQTLTSTIHTITGSNEEVTGMGVYVLKDDPAESIADASDYVFGILENIEREDTDNAVIQINEELNSFVQVQTYAGMDDLADALLAQDCGAIVMNKQYVQVISELEGYESFEEDIREIASYEWSKAVEAAENAEGVEDAINGYGVFTVYISGIDTFGSISTKSRSDVNIIAVVNTNTKQVLLISTPRDYYVPLSISGGVKDKLTHAGLYGVNVSMDTLQMLYDIPINYYFRVNFSGFEQIIDALGGVDVVSEYDFTVDPVKHYTVGVNHLNGEEALAFARERHAFADGDRQRGKNQMAVITAVIQKMMTPAVLYNFSDLMTSLEGAFETDMPYSDLTTLVRNQISAGQAWDVQTYSVDGTGERASTFSLSKKVYVMVPDQATVDQAKALIEQMKNNEIISTENNSIEE